MNKEIASRFSTINKKYPIKTERTPTLANFFLAHTEHLQKS
jgi:hypothetical protein